jgi:hypothetical protein
MSLPGQPAASLEAAWESPGRDGRGRLKWGWRRSDISGV